MVFIRISRAYKNLFVESAISLQEHYRAAMVLSGTGDALGYYNGRWEFCHSGLTIFNEAQEMGGVENIQVKPPNWIVSDDTVMHLATGEALGETSGQPDREKLFLALASYYKLCMKDMAGRAPGATCMSEVHKLRPLLKDGYHIPFNPRPEDLKDLVAVSVESGRMTHHHPTGYLGSLASALFTALAIQGRAVKEWGRCLLDTLPLALTYIEETGYAVEENKQAWSYFSERWTEYLKERNLMSGTADPVFPTKYGFPERDAFYKKLSFSGWGGSSGHDAPMIAYDALLGAGFDWKELVHRSMFHSGDSDSTGVIAASWYGALYGFQGVPEGNHMFVEYRDRLVKVGDTLLDLAMPCFAQGKA